MSPEFSPISSNPSTVASFEFLSPLSTTSPEQFTYCLHLLCTSLPIELDAVRDIMPKPNGFVHTVLEAYNNHRGLILCPDDVWTAILTQFNFFFVAHEGKEEFIIIDDGNRHTADFALMARQMSELMHTHLVDPMLRDWIMPQFSTTTDVDRAVYAMSLMATMNECFRYNFILHSWYHLLHPIILQFVAAFNTPSSPENLDFWSKVAHYEGGGSGLTYLSGWITAFCVFNEQGVWQGPPLNAECMREDVPKKLLRLADPRTLSAAQFAAVYTVHGTWRPFLVLDGMPYPTIDDECVPCGCVHLYVKLDDNGELFDTVIVAGAVGAQICSNDKSELFRNGMRDSVRPVVGYWYFITGAG
ncbi:uncharacterized protein EDB91DRAFT_1240090 [Suillus paluster]|uniref:uncharacterized protein n=1 Tax=Suillus paluster TaxID=48578 RepID=UPI001B87231E|nr:uncharacterized protein EDB91DRAFT_1240090 [Suillus paluster]KAG1723540.1 hypothetical protein EDB91DRAFT_1240090 [Suillus paluster]